MRNTKTTIQASFHSIASDDGFWSVDTDFQGFELFLKSPRSFVKLYGDILLSEPYVIQVTYDNTLVESSVQIRARPHITANAKTAVLIEVAIHHARAAAENREAMHQITGESLAASLWDQVRLDFPSPLSMELTYIRTTSTGSGIIDKHLDIPDSGSKFFNLLRAISSEPSGYGLWLQNQNITLRQEMIAGVTQPLVRKPGTQEYFRSENGPLDYLVLGFDPLLGACQPGQTLIACNATRGTYQGDPTQTDTHVDSDRITFKWYCR